MMRWGLAALAATLWMDITPSSQRFNPSTAKVWGSMSGNGRIMAIDISRDGRKLVSLSSTHELTLWDFHKRAKIRTFPNPLGQTRVQMTPDGTRIVCPGNDKPWTLKVFDAQKGRELRAFSNVNYANGGFAISPDGKRVVALKTDGTVCVYDMASGDEKHQLIGRRTAEGGSVAWSPDGRHIACVGRDAVGRIFSAETGEKTGTLEGAMMISALTQFSPDSKSLLVVGPDSRLRVYDVASGRERQALDGPRGITSAAFMPGGKYLAVSCSGWIQIWDCRTWKEARRIEADRTMALTFTPDGRRLVSGHRDGTIQMWGAGGAPKPAPRPYRPGNPGYLGVTAQTESDEEKGVPLSSVEAGSAADEAGLQSGDVILKVNKVTTDTFEELRHAITDLREGDEVTITYLREGVEKTTKTKLGGR
ncbi:MAG: PDZ domain-containing protein [Planctomycetes bacterium]|nr:PDZ domain-containing protein [Planctomycetota bacterium]